MQHRILLVLPLAVLLMACGAAPNGAASRLTNRTAATVNSGSFRIDGQPNGSGWTIRSPIPEPLGVAQGAAVASADGSRIYHIGGITGALLPTKKVRVYSPADDTWSEGTDIPVSTGIRTFGAAVELNGFIYVFGGVDDTEVLDTTWIYDEAKSAWFEGANMPGPRFGSAVVADGNIIWVAGGARGLSRAEAESISLWQYDPSSDTWPWADETPAAFFGRSRGVVLPSGDVHLLVGGFDGTTHMGFNFREHRSFPGPQVPYGVTDAAVATDGVRIYVAGGGGPAPRAPGRTQIFDSVSRTWSLGPAMPSGVDNTSGVIANGTLYVMGGYDGTNPVSVNYSLSLSSLGAQEPVSSGAMNSDAVVALDSRKLNLDGQPAGTGWRTNWPIPEALGCAQGATLASSDGSLIYHVGGLVGFGVSNRMRVYSPADDIGDASAMRSPWWDAASVPLSHGLRSYASAVELNGFIYIFGGVSGDTPSFEVLNTTLIYDEANDSWFRGADMPGRRFGPAVATDGSVIWVMGGYNELMGPDHTVWMYNPTADGYSTGFANMPMDLGRIHGAWLPDGTVHVFGGAESTLNNHLVYDTLANVWSPAPLIPLGVLDPATVTDGTFIYLAGSPIGPFPLEPGHTQIFDPLSGSWSEGPRMPGPWGVDNTSGTIANGVFYVMGGTWGGIFNSLSYSISMSELAAFNR